MATHAIVMARLFVPSSSLLIRNRYSQIADSPFVVQIRSTKDHLPLPGIQCGDIGDKMGHNAVERVYASITFEYRKTPCLWATRKY